MKKFSVFLLILLIVESLIGCNKQITYTSEFEYLPMYKGMVVEDFKEPSEEGMGIAVYKLKGLSSDEVLGKYESLLKKYGWKTTQDNKPASITVEKDNHKAIIATSKTEEGTKLTIMSK